jgi:hypothetical protein
MPPVRSNGDQTIVLPPPGAAIGSAGPEDLQEVSRLINNQRKSSKRRAQFGMSEMNGGPACGFRNPVSKKQKLALGNV